MNFTFQEDDVKNTTLLQPTGAPIYVVETSKNDVTTIRRVDGPSPFDAATIEWHTFHETKVFVRGRPLKPMKTSTLGSSKVFTGADGKVYRWEIKHGNPLLFREDGSNAQVAAFTSGESHTFHKSKNRPATFYVSPEGLNILDDVFTTLVYIEQKNREDSQPTGGGYSYGSTG